MSIRFLTTLRLNIRLGLAGKAVRAKLIGAPVQEYIRTHGRDRDITVADFGYQVFSRGLAHPKTAIEIINNIDPKGVSKKKWQALQEEIIPGLRNWNRTFAMYKSLPLVFVFCLGITLFSLFSSGKEDKKQLVEQKPKPYITLNIPPEEYTLYPQNEWFKVVQEECGVRQSYSEARLDACLGTRFGGRVRNSGFHAYLQSLESVTVVLGEREYARHAEILEAVKEMEPIEIESMSTAEGEKAVNLLGSEPVDFPVYANHYCRVYGFNVPNLPEAFQGIDLVPVFDLVNFVSFASANTQPILYRMVDQTTNPPTVQYVPLDMTKMEYGLDVARLRGALGIAKGFSSDIEIAAKLLHGLHPNVPERLFALMIYRRAVMFAAALRYEDPWQDIGLCEMVNCQYLAAFKKEFAGVEYGVRMGDGFIRPPWLLGTKLHTPLEKQAFGPFSLLFGLSKESASATVSQSLLTELFPGLDLQDNNTLGRLLFDKPAYVYALQVHYILSKLEEKIFNDPRVALSPIIPPFVMDQEVARQMAISASISILTCHPERDEIYTLISVVDFHDFMFNAVTADLLEQCPPFENIMWRRLTLTLENGSKVLSYLTYGNQVVLKRK